MEKLKNFEYFLRVLDQLSPSDQSQVACMTVSLTKVTQFLRFSGYKGNKVAQPQNIFSLVVLPSPSSPDQ